MLKSAMGMTYHTRLRRKFQVTSVGSNGSAKLSEGMTLILFLSITSK